MPRKAFLIAVLLCLIVLPLTAQETPPPTVDAYESLADVILAVRQAEADFVRSLLDGHHHAAHLLQQKGDWQGAAAQVALFANEGDNAVGGVRKRLLEGGHHFNASGEEQGIYEPGYVTVTREAKQKLLAVSAALRQGDEAARSEAWNDFTAIAKKLLTKK